MRTTNIWTLITYLNTKNSITAIVGSRIFYGIPNSEQTQTYITINKITSRTPTGAEWIERIEIRYIWGDASVSFATLESLDDKVFTELEKYKSDWVYKIVNSNSFNYYDEKNRKCFLRDYLIHRTI